MAKRKSVKGEDELIADMSGALAETVHSPTPSTSAAADKPGKRSSRKGAKKAAAKEQPAPSPAPPPSTQETIAPAEAVKLRRQRNEARAALDDERMQAALARRERDQARAERDQARAELTEAQREVLAAHRDVADARTTLEAAQGKLRQLRALAAAAGGAPSSSSEAEARVADQLEEAHKKLDAAMADLEQARIDAEKAKALVEMERMAPPEKNRCPKCGGIMSGGELSGAPVLRCSACDSVCIDAGEIVRLLPRSEKSGLTDLSLLGPSASSVTLPPEEADKPGFWKTIFKRK
jgi:hypothetical protein